MWQERRHVTVKDLLSKIYDYVINYEDDSIKLGSKFDVEVKKAIQPLKESMTAEELECIKGIVYSTAYTAEKNGFYRKRIVSGCSPEKTGILARDARHASILL